MNHSDILKSADQISQRHARTYGPEEMCYDRIANLATLILNKELTPHDIAMVEVAISLGRLQEDRKNPEHYVMAAKQLSFGGQFAATESVSTALEDDIAAMARRFAPKRSQMPVTPEEQSVAMESIANYAAPQQDEPKNA
jgi:hypothetical protein